MDDFVWAKRTQSEGLQLEDGQHNARAVEAFRCHGERKVHWSGLSTIHARKTGAKVLGQSQVSPSF